MVSHKEPNAKRATDYCLIESCLLNILHSLRPYYSGRRLWTELWSSSEKFRFEPRFRTKLQQHYYQCPLPLNVPKDTIFFEALAVCLAMMLVWSFRKTTRLIIYTNNTNTFKIFTSLATKPVYNKILLSSINMLIQEKSDLQVVGIWQLGQYLRRWVIPLLCLLMMQRHSLLLFNYYCCTIV